MFTMAVHNDNYSSCSCVKSWCDNRPKSGPSGRHRTDSKGTNDPSNNHERRSSFSAFTMGFSKLITKSFRKKRGQKRTDRNDSETSEESDLTEVTLLHSAKELLRYPHADMDRYFGCGVLVLITMFTENLKGYKKDNVNVKSFFECLDYDIFEAPLNCNKADLYEFLRRTQLEIQGNEKQYDRLFCIIMSHGLKDGLLTCSDGNGQMEETQPATSDNGSADVLLTPVDDIVRFFKHDRLPKLKGFPKQFMIQACKGLNVVKAASGLKRSRTNSGTGIVSAGSSTSSDLSTSAGSAATSVQDCANFMIRPTIPVDGDISICYASTNDNMSFVDDYSGSWFIEVVIGTFKQYMHEYHVADMLTIAKDRVSERRKNFLLGDPDGNEVRAQAVQMPYTNTTFRKQFWLQSSRVENPWLSHQPMTCHPSHCSTCPQSLNNLGSPLFSASPIGPYAYVNTYTPSPNSLQTETHFVFHETVPENDTLEERGMRTRTGSASAPKTKTKLNVNLQWMFSEQLYVGVRGGCRPVEESFMTVPSSFYLCNMAHCVTRCTCRSYSQDALPTHYHKAESCHLPNTARKTSGNEVPSMFKEQRSFDVDDSVVGGDSGGNTPTVDLERPIFYTE